MKVKVIGSTFKRKSLLLERKGIAIEKEGD